MKPHHSRIMVVDDDPAMLRAVERILDRSHQVSSFSSGEKAIEAFRNDPVDVAIVDVRMPGMDGYNLTRAIKEIRPRTEVILVTGSVTDLDDKLVRSVKERAGYFITKPFSRAVLTSLVDRCLEMQRLEEERNLLIGRLTEDLARARRYQQALLPKGLPRSFGPIYTAATYFTSESIGGDLFDVMPLSDDRVLLMVADVVGHGVAAALVTGMVKTAIGRALQDEEGLAPAAEAIIATLAPLGQHRVVTIILAAVDHRKGTLEYLNAGHPPALIWGNDGESKQLSATTPLLSFGFDLAPTPTVTVPFRPGERIALYTDGLYETLDPAGSDFGRERLLQALLEHRGPIEEVVTSVDEAVRSHAGGRPPDDDMTLLIAEFTKRG